LSGTAALDRPWGDEGENPMTITITAFERSPDRGKGLARNMRVERIHGPPQALDRRAHHRMAQSLPQARKDWENFNRKGLAFLRLASIRLMLRKLCNPA
jgi:hypothetical protein